MISGFLPDARARAYRERMSTTDAQAVKALLTRWRSGDIAARDRLVALFYPDLQKTAAAMARYDRSASFSSADLVQETVMRLIRLERIDWQDRAHFLALSSRLMRRALIDHVRARRAGKRDHVRVELTSAVAGEPNFDLELVERALRKLAEADQGHADIVEMRYFGGMSLADIASVLDCSEVTVKRRWRVARAWLIDEIGPTAEVTAAQIAAAPLSAAPLTG